MGDGPIASRLRPPPHAPPTGPRHRGDPPPPGRRGAAPVARRPGRDGRPGRRAPLLGVRLGRRARHRPLPARAPRGRRRPAGRRLRRPAPACARSRPCGPARRRRPASTSIAFAVAAIDLNARANGVRVTVRSTRRPRRGAAGRRTSSSPATAGTRRASPSRVLPWLRRAAATAASTSSSATPAVATCRPTISSSSPRYEVRTTTELEDLDHKEGRVYRSAAAEITASAGPKMPRSHDVARGR